VQTKLITTSITILFTYSFIK